MAPVLLEPLDLLDQLANLDQLDHWDHLVNWDHQDLLGQVDPQGCQAAQGLLDNKEIRGQLDLLDLLADLE